MTEQVADTTTAEAVTDTTTAATTEATADTTTTDAKAADTTKTGTLAEGDTEDRRVVAPADFPEDWRVKMAGGDDKAAKQLERFKSPVEVAKALREAQAKVSQMKPELAADATEEQVAAWRKSAGIPEKPEGYLEKLPDGLVIGEDDKPMVDSFLTAAHGKNFPPDFVGTALNWYYDMQDREAAAQSDMDGKNRGAAVEELRAEWGNEYQTNLNGFTGLLDSAPAIVVGDKEVPFGKFLGAARLPDGRLLGDHPAVIRWVSGLASEINPGGFIAPSGGVNGQGIDDEIAKIETLMRTDRAAYDRDPNQAKRLGQLLEAKERLAKRA